MLIKKNEKIYIKYYYILKFALLLLFVHFTIRQLIHSIMSCHDHFQQHNSFLFS